MAARQPRPQTKPREITITVKVRSIINGVLQEHVMRTLVDELVARVGTEANPNCVSVELVVTGELDTDRRWER